MAYSLSKNSGETIAMIQTLHDNSIDFVGLMDNYYIQSVCVGVGVGVGVGGGGVGGGGGLSYPCNDTKISPRWTHVAVGDDRVDMGR